jgi:hypothetical protein
MKPGMKRFLGGAGRFAARLLLLLALFLGTWRTFIQPWAWQWGSGDAERNSALPGDESYAGSRYRPTYAIAIRAAPERAWAWLVQIGQDRAGFYSYSFLERLAGARIHNQIEIRPEWQVRKAGETVPLTQPEYMGGKNRALTQLKVLRVERARALVLSGWGSFVLLPREEGRACLFLIRSYYFDSPGTRFLNSLFFDPVHFLMQRRMMRSIRDLAERPDGAVLPRIPSPGDWTWFFSHLLAGMLLLAAANRRGFVSSAGSAFLTVLLTFSFFRLPPSPVPGLITLLASALWLRFVIRRRGKT